MVLLQHLQDQPAAEGLLLGNGFELGQLLGRVVQVLLKQHLLVVKHADLGGRGAGIDGQNSVRHKTYLLYACIVCSFFNESIITPVKTSVNGIFHHFATLFCRKSCLFFASIDRREAERHLRLPGGGVQLQDHGAVVAAHDLS